MLCILSQSSACLVQSYVSMSSTQAVWSRLSAFECPPQLSMQDPKSHPQLLALLAARSDICMMTNINCLLIAR